MASWTAPVFAYNVSGVVDFAYRQFDTKRGSIKTSRTDFIQHYQLNLYSPIYDPRFLTLTAGVNYSITDSDPQQDSTQLGYNLNALFFPGMKVSWNLFAAENTITVDSDFSLAGYDVNTSQHGGTLYLNLAGPGRNRSNNNYYNNNNNNNGGRRAVPLPDIELSSIRTESESLSTARAFHEKRDNYKGSLRYNLRAVDLEFTAEMEQFDRLDGSPYSYETKSGSLASRVYLSSRADLTIRGRMADQSTENMLLVSDSKSESLGVVLDVHEQDRVSHSYGYDHASSESGSVEMTTDKAYARIRYRVMPELQLLAGFDYLVSKVTASTTGELEQGGAMAGASYLKVYKPSFLGPFQFSTSYDFSAGYSDYSSDAGTMEGNGRYYRNNAALGFEAAGWKNEQASFYYTFANQRDSSPLANDTENQTFKLALSTLRVPRTSIQANASYTSQKTAAAGGGIFVYTDANTKQGQRYYNFNLAANFAATTELSLLAGAARGKTATRIEYTLSTIVPDAVFYGEDEYYYAGANYKHAITRTMTIRGDVRDELRKTATKKIQSYVLDMFLDYRIRQVFLNLEYKIRQENPDDMQKWTEQMLYAKISRPF